MAARPANATAGSIGKKCYNIGATTFEIDSHYEVSRMVGQGAYGSVVSAVDTSTGEKVVIKKISHVFEDLVDGKRILREIKLLGFLRHTNILSLKDLLRPSDPEHFSDVYLVTEQMDADLHHIIRSKQRLLEDHVQFFMYQLLCGLHFMHSAGVMHRDLKPGNLLVSTNCELRICDFGLARGCEGATNLTDYVVTRWYRPPELLLMCDTYSCAVDLWAVGCLTVELMSRKPLFPGRDYIHQINLITDTLGLPTAAELATIKSAEALAYINSMPKKKGRRDDFANLCSGGSADLVDFVSKLLQFNPSQRLDAKAALQHPFFSQLFDERDLEIAPKKYFWEYDSVDITEAQLRLGIWNEIIAFHPQ